MTCLKSANGIDYSKATMDELETIAYEDDYAGVMDKAHALIQIVHRQIDIFEMI